MLNPGENAPEFQELSDNKGKRIVLYFYPKDDTPGCTIEAQDFSTLKQNFDDANTVVFGVSKDSNDSHGKFCQKYNLSIQLISDPDMRIIAPYGIWQEKKNYGKTYMGIVRSTYVIGTDGTVEKVWKNVKAAGHAQQVLEYING